MNVIDRSCLLLVLFLFILVSHSSLGLLGFDEHLSSNEQVSLDASSRVLVVNSCDVNSINWKVAGTRALLVHEGNFEFIFQLNCAERHAHQVEAAHQYSAEDN